MNDLEALKLIIEALDNLEDSEARKWVITSVNARYGGVSSVSQTVTQVVSEPVTQTKEPSASKIRKSKSGKAKSFSMMDLNLRPSGQEAFSEFCEKRNPSSTDEKLVVSVYYLSKLLNVPSVSSNHVYTCFKAMKWSLPANLENALSLAKHHGGWLNTSSMQNIQVTSLGENLVDHDLPRKKK